MAWDFSTDPDFAEDLEWIRRVVIEDIEPLDAVKQQMSRDSWERAVAPLKQQVKDRGLWAAHLPPELGGEGFGQLRLALMHEILGRTPSAPLVFGNQAPDSGNSELLAVGASPEQKERWLRPLLAGDLTSSFALTEPFTAGSDPRLIRTSAVRDGDHYVVNGHKWFASNASIADFILAMVVTRPDAEPHHRASMLVIPAGTPGMEIVRDIPTMHHPYPGGDAHHSGGHAEIRFEDCRVPVDHRIGGDGEGFVLAQKRLSGGRIQHAMRWIGQCRRAFDMMCERAVSREAHGRRLADQQFVQEMIAESATEIRAARLMTLHTAWLWDTHGPQAARTEISQIKYWGARVLHNVIDRAIQVHGGLGFSADMPLEEMYRRARQYRIADGADEVHKQTVARRVLRDYAPVDGWPSEHVPTRRAGAEQRFAEYLDLATGNL